jgi:hypothetical protein
MKIFMSASLATKSKPRKLVAGCSGYRQRLWRQGGLRLETRVRGRLLRVLARFLFKGKGFSGLNSILSLLQLSSSPFTILVKACITLYLSIQNFLHRCSASRNSIAKMIGWERRPSVSMRFSSQVGSFVESPLHLIEESPPGSTVYRVTGVFLVVFHAHLT